MPPRSLDDLESAEKLLVLACRRTLPGRVAGPCVECAMTLAQVMSVAGLHLRHPGIFRADGLYALPASA